MCFRMFRELKMALKRHTFDNFKLTRQKADEYI